MAGQLITQAELWWRTPRGDVVRVRPTAPDQNGRGRVEMRWASGDVAYVWERHMTLLLDTGSVPCDPQPGMLA